MEEIMELLESNSNGNKETNSKSNSNNEAH